MGDKRSNSLETLGCVIPKIKENTITWVSQTVNYWNFPDHKGNSRILLSNPGFGISSNFLVNGNYILEIPYLG